MVTAEEDRDGYANRYSLDLRGLNVLDLSQKGFTTLHWITLLLQNRVFTLKNDIIKAGKRYLVEHFSLLCLRREFSEQYDFRSAAFGSIEIGKFG